MLDLSRLSPAQCRVALAPDGPLLVVAGPGSGKTTALVARVAVLTALRGVNPATILVLTFTTAAARELRLRLTRVLSERGALVQVFTFHAFGLRLIRQWRRSLGLGSGPVIVYGPDDARLLLRQAAGTRVTCTSGVSLGELTGRVERFRLGGPVRPDTPNGDVGDARDAVDGDIAALAATYERLLTTRGAVDFTAMLALPMRLFSQSAEALRACQQTYCHVLCDEGQDLCSTQHALLRAVAARQRNLTVVADPAQTIYGWRGADVRFLRDFRRHFPEAQVLTLEQSFRSTRSIVAVANALAAPLAYRPPLWTANGQGETVVLHLAADERAEACFVAREIKRLRASGQVERLGEVAVLFRTNGQARELTFALRAARLAYRVWGHGDVFLRREVRDAIAYLRLAHSPADRLALARIVDTPPRGLGPVAARLRAEPAPVDDLPRLAAALAPDALPAATALLAIVEDQHARSASAGPAALLDEALARTGYLAWLASLPDGAERQRTLRALRAAAQESEASLADWLAQLQLGESLSEQETAESADRVVLATVHAAKGKEWRVVFVTGVEEGLLPHTRAVLDSPAACRSSPSPDCPREDPLEEELRVAYVGVTRPRDRLYLTGCRHRGDHARPRQPSRFLRLVPDALLCRVP